jgi:hypothetical protein
MRRVLDPFALAASVLGGVMLAVYVSVTRQQEGDPATWVVAALILGVTAAGYGSVAAVPYRRPSLVLGGLVLVALGLLAILTLGLPILAAGALCLVAAVRAEPAPRAAERDHG